MGQDVRVCFFLRLRRPSRATFSCRVGDFLLLPSNRFNPYSGEPAQDIHAVHVMLQYRSTPLFFSSPRTYTHTSGHRRRHPRDMRHPVVLREDNVVYVYTIIYIF